MRILLTRISAFGDVIHCWPLAAALAGAGHDVAWLVEDSLAALVRGHPAVSRVIVVATHRWRRRFAAVDTFREISRCRGEVRGFRPDVALDPQGLVKSALWAWQSGAPRRVGLASAARRERLAGLFYSETVAPPASASHVVDINLALLGSLADEVPYGAMPDGRFLLGATTGGGGGLAGPTRGDPRSPIALLPGAATRSKQWPLEAFATLAARCVASGRPVVVVWGPGEEPLASRVVQAIGGGATLAPRTDIARLADLLAGCAAAVGGDTGPIHLAAALGVPTVAVFLATDPTRNAPRGARVAVVSSAPAGATRGRAYTARGGDVPVQPVDNALQRLLAAESASIPS